MKPLIVIPRKLPIQPATERLAVGAREAARLLSVSERTIRAWTSQGKLPCRKIGSRVLYSVAVLEKLLADGSDPKEICSKKQ